MPSEAKPLFRADALRPKLVGFRLPATVGEARQKLAHWVDLLATKKAEALKETELLPLFITDLFERLLGFTGPASGDITYTLKREALIQVDGKYADAALGRFAVGGGKPEFIAVLEGKGPRDPLDRPFGGRKLSAVDQALRYAVNLLCDWYLVTNLHEVRVYHKGHDQFTYERFEMIWRYRTSSGCSEQSGRRRRRDGAISTTCWGFERYPRGHCFPPRVEGKCRVGRPRE